MYYYDNGVTVQPILDMREIDETNYKGLAHVTSKTSFISKHIQIKIKWVDDTEQWITVDRNYIIYNQVKVK